MKALLLLLSFGLGTLAFASDIDAHYKGRLVPGVWAEDWSTILDSGLVANSLLNHNEVQIDTMCPGYRDDEAKRKLFWHQLFISLAWKESLHGPGNYIHFNGGINSGLYQINPKLRSAYNCGDIDLYDAGKNIECAAKMAKKLIDRFGSFLVGAKGGMAAYWQPLRSTSSLNRKNREFILSNVREACRTGALEFHSRDFIAAGNASPLDQADLTFNGVEDLGLEPHEIELDAQDGANRLPETWFHSL